MSTVPNKLGVGTVIRLDGLRDTYHERLAKNAYTELFLQLHALRPRFSPKSWGISS
jgi:hypothetical protein